MACVLCAVQWWEDYQLQWNEDEFHISYDLRINPDRVWTPDIVLFNKYAYTIHSTHLYTVHNVGLLYLYKYRKH